MLTLVLAGYPIVGIVVLVLKLFVELAMLPRRQSLFVCLGMFFVEPIMNVIVPLVEPVMLMIMATFPAIVLRCRGRCSSQYRQCTKGSDGQFTHPNLLCSPNHP